MYKDVRTTAKYVLIAFLLYAGAFFVHGAVKTLTKAVQANCVDCGSPLPK